MVAKHNPISRVTRLLQGASGQSGNAFKLGSIASTDGTDRFRWFVDFLQVNCDEAQKPALCLIGGFSYSITSRSRGSF